MSEAKQQNYLHGAAIMAGTTVIVKIVAFAYKIPLGSMMLLGDEGYAHFQVAYNIYSFFLTLATAGFPIALSRMISVSVTLDRPAQAQRIFKVALGVLAGIGGFFTLIMLAFHQPLAVLMGDPLASESITALSFAVVIVCLTSAYRGYCQGRGNMIPTAYGQVVEEVGKLIVGLSLAWVLLRTGHELSTASAGAIFGVTAGGLGALAYMAYCKRKYYPQRTYGMSDIPDSRGRIVRNFLRIGIPIAIGSSVLSLINLLDNSLTLNRLQSAAGFTSGEANILYGVYGKAQTFYNLPSYFITPLTLSVVPAIATCMAKRQRAEAGEIAESALRITAVIAMPMGVGLSILSEPVMRGVYWGSNAAGPTLLRVLGIAAFFVCMSMIGNSVLQAAGLERLPIISIILGGIVKIGVNWFLVGNPQINITGAPVGSICCFAVVCIADYYFLCKTMPKPPRLSRVLGAPLVSSAVMGVATWATYGLSFRALSLIGGSERMMMLAAMVVAMAVSTVVYVILIGQTRAVTMDDMELIPHGEKLGRLMHLKKDIH